MITSEGHKVELPTYGYTDGDPNYNSIGLKSIFFCISLHGHFCVCERGVFLGGEEVYKYFAGFCGVFFTIRDISKADFIN
jgi:hypothetical protein